MSFLRKFFSGRSEAEMAETTSKVQQLIDDNAAVVFAKSWCPHCRNTRQTLDKLGADYKVLELDLLPDGDAIQDALEQINGQHTVPNVYIKQEHIGGNSDLQALAKSGRLEPLLKDAGALKA